MSDTPVSLNLPVGPPPVGLIITSVLTWDELNLHFPGFEEFWLPCDGRSVPAGSVLEKVLAQRGEHAPATVPDLRKKVLRGRPDFDAISAAPSSEPIALENAEHDADKASNVFFYVRVN